MRRHRAVACARSGVRSLRRRSVGSPRTSATRASSWCNGRAAPAGCRADARPRRPEHRLRLHASGTRPPAASASPSYPTLAFEHADLTGSSRCRPLTTRLPSPHPRPHHTGGCGHRGSQSSPMIWRTAQRERAPAARRPLRRCWSRVITSTSSHPGDDRGVRAGARLATLGRVRRELVQRPSTPRVVPEQPRRWPDRHSAPSPGVYLLEQAVGRVSIVITPVGEGDDERDGDEPTTVEATSRSCAGLVSITPVQRATRCGASRHRTTLEADQIVHPTGRRRRTPSRRAARVLYSNSADERLGPPCGRRRSVEG